MKPAEGGKAFHRIVGKGVFEGRQKREKLYSTVKTRPSGGERGTSLPTDPPVGEKRPRRKAVELTGRLKKKSGPGKDGGLLSESALLTCAETREEKLTEMRISLSGNREKGG